MAHTRGPAGDLESAAEVLHGLVEALEVDGGPAERVERVEHRLEFVIAELPPASTVLSYCTVALATSTFEATSANAAPTPARTASSPLPLPPRAPPGRGRAPSRSRCPSARGTAAAARRARTSGGSAPRGADRLQARDRAQGPLPLVDLREVDEELGSSSSPESPIAASIASWASPSCPPASSARPSSAEQPPPRSTSASGTRPIAVRSQCAANIGARVSVSARRLAQQRDRSASPGWALRATWWARARGRHPCREHGGRAPCAASRQPSPNPRRRPAAPTGGGTRSAPAFARNHDPPRSPRRQLRAPVELRDLRGQPESERLARHRGRLQQRDATRRRARAALGQRGRDRPGQPKAPFEQAPPPSPRRPAGQRRGSAHQQLEAEGIPGRGVQQRYAHGPGTSSPTSSAASSRVSGFGSMTSGPPARRRRARRETRHASFGRYAAAITTHPSADGGRARGEAPSRPHPPSGGRRAAVRGRAWRRAREQAGDRTMSLVALDWRLL